MSDIAITAMPNDEQIIEAMARGICRTRYGHLRGYKGREEWYRKEAQAALGAQRAMGLVLVPSSKIADLQSRISYLEGLVSGMRAALAKIAAMKEQQ